ncbi:DJ-1/PfpI family protein [Cohnella candidum]|uniref:DJ-1/PfpI family protein n=1 Tax=Cohnella candidum TaxID=2674991 RepID=A0A3G3JYU5_9BACL|nr:DJ-1/PfpI family protein [Cohnella candidum]AYQ73021.1 DJ-1/PfpI family protein [Cohnella candidum]
MLNVQIVLFDGFDLLDAIAPYEVFSAAGLFTDRKMQVEFVTAEGPRQVTSGVNGLKIEATGKLNGEQPGIILVPGAAGELEGDGPDAVPALLARAANSELAGVIEKGLARGDITVSTVCGGSLVLAMAGLLEGRPAVTNHLGMDLLGATGAIPVSARVVDDGNFVSGGGVTSGLDVAIHLVERELGPRIAHAIEQLFEFERRGTVWRNTGNAPSSSAKEAPMVESTSDLSRHTAPNSIFDGEWDTVIATPVGKLQVKLNIATVKGVIQGTAAQGDEISAFIDPEISGEVLRWSQQITKPLRLNLKFEVVVDGDVMTGFAKAGVLPASKLTGKRL